MNFPSWLTVALLIHISYGMENVTKNDSPKQINVSQDLESMLEDLTNKLKGTELETFSVKMIEKTKKFREDKWTQDQTLKDLCSEIENAFKQPNSIFSEGYKRAEVAYVDGGLQEVVKNVKSLEEWSTSEEDSNWLGLWVFREDDKFKVVRVGRNSGFGFIHLICKDASGETTTCEHIRRDIRNVMKKSSDNQPLPNKAPTYKIVSSTEEDEYVLWCLFQAITAEPMTEEKLEELRGIKENPNSRPI